MKTLLTLILSVVVLVKSNSSYEECGKTVNDEQFPWNVGIYFETGNELELICFGTIIKPKAILTSAQCFSNNIEGSLRNDTFYLIWGNLQKRFKISDNTINKQKIIKTDIAIHKEYNGLLSLLSSNLGIVKLNTEFNFNKNLQPICLDWSNFIKDKGDYGKQAAWENNKMKIIEQRYVNSEDCELIAPKSFVPFLTSDKACTKIKGPKPSHEDEGAGLVFFSSEDNAWYLKGVISSHEPTKLELTTYTKVSQHLNWISNICARL